MSDSGASVQVCLLVPAGTWSLIPLIDAIHAAHPGWRIVAVWCGDPHLRPVLDATGGATWCDLDLSEPTGAGWGRLLVGLPKRAYEWARGAAAIARLVDDGEAGASVVALRVGSVAVLGDCSALIGEAPLTLVPRSPHGLPDDGLAPSEADLVHEGRNSTSIVAFGSGSGSALAWLCRHLGGSDHDSVGPWFDRAGELFGAAHCGDASIGAGPWRPVTEPPALLDLDHLDLEHPWHFSFRSGPSRSRLSAAPLLADAVAVGLDQMAVESTSIMLPGGIAVDEPIRALMRDALRRWRADGAALPPEPFGPHQSAFVRWLEEPSPIWGANVGRYWRELREQRADLLAAFPRSDSADQDRYIEWAEASWRMEERSVLLRPSNGSPRVPVTSIGANANGINVAGYLGFDASLGDVARRIVAALDAAHVPVSPIDHFRTGSPRRSDAQPPANEARFATNLVVVNADQFHFFAADHGPTLLDGRRTIAYWFWELEDVPGHMVQAIDHVDEIWVGSQFVADAFSRVTDKPVRRVPIPVPEPTPAGRDRASFGLPEDAFVFATTFDHFSVAERKNPYGAIEAFRRAFGEDDGAVLFVKTVNGDKRWANHERLLLAAAGRKDIVVVDAHVDRDDQMAALAVSDCLVSLHRSEGLGLHCAEAMWLGKPVIATRYSGNLDFMDDGCSVLIDHTMVPVTHGEGVYPTSAHWADPDLEAAASAMQRLAGDRELAAGIGGRARERMQRQPSLAETGRTIARLAGLGPYDPDGGRPRSNRSRPRKAR